MSDASSQQAPKPIAFMVMPFGKKPPSIEKGGRIPDLIDFDQLWREVFKPVLSKKYKPIRADQDYGPLILVEMIERLAAADLVVADLTLRNANVYWEIGVRQAAKPAGCVLVAADWTQPAFDLNQVRQLRYPLPSGEPTAKQLEDARTALAAGLDEFAESYSPVFAAVPGFPDPDPAQLNSFENYATEMSDFHERITVIRRTHANKDEFAQKTLALLADSPPSEPRPKATVWEILQLVRDALGWQAVVDYVDQLPNGLRRDPDIQEQLFLAVGKVGKPADAAVKLETLIKDLGETGERCGILGGRYKQLWRESEPDSLAAVRYLRQAIEAYETGMNADLNAYYCASNLPRLYRSLDSEDSDLQSKARRATEITKAACHRALTLDRGDEWLRPTLLTTAFEEGDIDEVRWLVREIKIEGANEWKLDTLIRDLELSLTRHSQNVQAILRPELANLKNLSDS